jgi:hypothetical protein
MPSERLEKIDQLTVSPCRPEWRNGAPPYRYGVSRRGWGFTFFTSEAAFWRFIEERALRCDKIGLGTTEIGGAFYRFETMHALPIGIETRIRRGRHYTRATITEHEGVRVVNYHHVDAKNRVIYDFAESRNCWESSYVRGSFEAAWKARELGGHAKSVVVQGRKYDSVRYIVGSQIEPFIESGVHYGHINSDEWGAWVAVNANDYQRALAARREEPRD